MYLILLLSQFTPIVTTLDDVNISVTVKNTKAEQTSGPSDVLDIAYTTTMHFTASSKGLLLIYNLHIIIIIILY